MITNKPSAYFLYTYVVATTLSGQSHQACAITARCPLRFIHRRGYVFSRPSRYTFDLWSMCSKDRPLACRPCSASRRWMFLRLDHTTHTACPTRHLEGGVRSRSGEASDPDAGLGMYIPKHSQGHRQHSKSIISVCRRTWFAKYKTKSKMQSTNSHLYLHEYGGRL